MSDVALVRHGRSLGPSETITLVDGETIRVTPRQGLLGGSGRKRNGNKIVDVGDLLPQDHDEESSRAPLDNGQASAGFIAQAGPAENKEGIKKLRLAVKKKYKNAGVFVTLFDDDDADFKNFFMKTLKKEDLERLDSVELDDGCDDDLKSQCKYFLLLSRKL